MPLLKEEEVKEFLKKKNVQPFKGLGQNFLVSQEVSNKIISAEQITKKDVILEIGPGLGALTNDLARLGKKVIAVEKDKKLAKFLENTFKENKDVRIVKGDILETPISALLKELELEKYKVIANLPYNIALPIIRKFIEAEKPPKEMVLMVQKEVALKICSKKSSLPKIAIEFYAQANFLFRVPKELFWPQPKVDGAVVKIDHIQENVPDVDKKLFFKILKSGFSSPRKTILNNFIKQFEIKKEKIIKILLNCNISPQKRAQEIELDSWVRLSHSFSNLNMIK